MIGNAWGNAFDALRSRLTGNPTQDFSIWDALGVIVGPFVMIPAILMGRLFSQQSYPSLIEN
jgi:hypothetical protein